MSFEGDLQVVIATFPGNFNRALADWAKFKVGARAGLFAESGRSEVVGWYREFPKLWELIRPNFIKTVRTPQGSMIDPAYASLVGRVDRFVKQLGADLSGGGLAIAPLIIAGIILAGGLGLAGASWAIAYFKKQSNISTLIEQVTAGKISPDILAKAIEQEQILTNPLSDLGGAFKWAVTGFALFLAMPLIERLVSRVGPKD